MIYDDIIVGSGAAGVMTAYGLGAGRKTLMLDVGHTEENPWRLRYLFDCVRGRLPFNPRLLQKDNAAVFKDSTTLLPLGGSGFCGAATHAQGGFATAWGGGVYRYQRKDLGSDCLIDPWALGPYYEAVAEAMGGIEGSNNVIAPEFGHECWLRAPAPLSSCCQHLLDHSFTSFRVRCGHSRQVVWNPRQTLHAMRALDMVTLQSGYLVDRFTEEDGVITVYGRDVRSRVGIQFY